MEVRTGVKASMMRDRASAHIKRLARFRQGDGRRRETVTRCVQDFKCVEQLLFPEDWEEREKG